MQSCPVEAKLSDYLSGRLSEEESESVASHVKNCDDCLSRIDGVDDSDPIVRQLRHPVQDDPFVNEAGCKLAVDSARLIAYEPDSDFGMLRDYRLTEKLGQGGMGTVYGAVHTKLDRSVAVKVLPAQRMQNPEAVTRFEREMKAIGKLQHPNIVQAYDAGEADGKHYLVMERVDGLDLSSLVRRLGPLPLADACEIIRQAAVGLQHAHEHELVHRDVKPSNIMVTPTGEVKVLDLGLALLNEPLAGEELTSTGQIMGTLDYMAPEQLGDSHEVDLRADIYSLGATLYKLLTGQAPYSSQKFNSPQRKLMAIATKPVPPVSEFRGDVSKPLIHVLDQMLAKNPDDRCLSAVAATSQLEPLCRGSNLRARMTEAATAPEADDAATRTSTIDPVRSSVTDTRSSRPRPLETPTSPSSEPHADHRRRQPIVAIFAAASLFLFAVALTIFYVGSGDATLIVKVNDEEAVVELREHGLVVRDTKTERKYTIWKPGESQLAAGNYQLSVADDAGLRVDTDEFVLSRRGEEIVTVRLAREKPSDLSASDSAKEQRSPQRDERGPFNPPSSNTRRSGEDTGGPLSATALVTRPTKLPGVISWTIETKAHRALNELTVVRFSPQGHLLAIGDITGTVRMHETESGLLSQVLVGHGDAVRGLAFSEDRKLLASASADHTIRIWDLHSGHCIDILQGHKDEVRAVHWLSADTLASVAYDATVRLWELDSGNSIRIDLNAPGREWVHGYALQSVSWSPDGESLATGDNTTQKVTVWDLDVDGATPRRMDGKLSLFQGRFGAIRWSPDGKSLAAGGGQSIRVWNPSTGKLQRSIETYGHHFAWSPDGKSIAARGAIWDLANGQETRQLDGCLRDRVFGAADWAPSGDFIAAAPHLMPLRIWSSDGDLISTVTNHSMVDYNATDWLSDGRLATWIGYHQLRIWDPMAAKSHAIRARADGYQFLVAARDQDRLLTFGNTDVDVIDTDGADRLVTFKTQTSVRSAAMSPDGQVIALGLQGPAVQIRDISGAIKKTLKFPTNNTANVQQLAFTSDGKRLAASDKNEVIHIWDVETSERISIDLYGVHKEWGYGLAFSPDQELLAAGSSNDIVLIDRRGNIVRTLETPLERVLSVAWRPDGSLLSQGIGESVNLWDADAEEPLVATMPAIPGLQAYGSPDRFSNDGRFLARSRNGVTRVLELDTSRTLSYAALGNNQYLIVSDEGHFRGSPWIEKQIVYVVKTEAGQETLAPSEFQSKYGWHNNPLAVSLPAERPPVAGFDHQASEATVDATDSGQRRTFDTTNPIGDKALVTRPARIDGLKTWSIETATVRGAFRGMARSALAMSPDDRQFAVASADGVLRIYDATDASLVSAWQSHSNFIESVSWSADRTLIATGGFEGMQDSNIKIWDAVTGRLVAEIDADGALDLDWSPTEKKLVVSANDLTIWSPTGIKQFPEQTTGVRSVAFSPDGEMLALGSYGQLRFWRNSERVFAHTIELPSSPEGDAHDVNVEWSPNGEAFALSTGAGLIQLWDATSWTRLCTLDSKATGGQVAFSPDSSTVAICTDSFREGLNHVGLFDVTTGALRKTMDLETQATGQSVVWSGDGETLIAYSWDGRIGLFNASNGSVAHRIVPVISSTHGWANSGQLTCMIKPDGSSWGYPLLRVWNPNSGVHWESRNRIASHSLKWSPNGQYVATGGDNHVQIVRNGRVGIELNCPPSFSYGFAWNPGGEKLAVGTENVIQIWDLREQKVQHTIDNISGTIDLDWGPADLLAIGTKHGKALIHDLKSAKTIYDETLDPRVWIVQVSFSPDGNQLAVVNDTSVRVIDVRTGNKVRDLPGSGGRVLDIQWIGNELQLTCEHGATRRWDLGSDELIISPVEYPRTTSLGAYASKFSPSGSLSATAIHGTGTWWICDVATAARRCAVTHLRGGRTMQISPEGHYLASADVADEIVYIAETQDGEKLTLTQDEFERRFGWKNDPSKARVRVD